MRWMWYLLFILLVFSMAAHAEKGGYIVEPYSPEDNLEDSLIDTSGADATISFWELPLWIKIAYISGIVLAFSGMLKLTPIILGRITNLLENHNRRYIFRYISNNPGCTIAEISDQEKINRGSVKYHIHKLESEERITLIKEEKFLRLFQNSSIFNANEKLIAAHVKNETSRLLLCAVVKNPGITNQELANKFNLAKSTTYWHLQKFNNDKIIIFETKGKYKKCFVNPAIETILPRFVPSIQQSISSKG